MLPGNRIYYDFERPDPELIARFSGIPSSNIGDMMCRMASMKSCIRPMNRAKLLGSAFTVRVPQGDNFLLHAALDVAKPGDVLVVDAGGGMDRAIAGEIMVTYAKVRGLAGLVVDGCMRDAEAIGGMDIPVYAKGISPNGPYKNGPGEMNVPVSCGGMVVFPGDILVGDADGIVVIPKAYAADVLAACKDKVELEERQLQDLHRGVLNDDVHRAAYLDKLPRP